MAVRALGTVLLASSCCALLFASVALSQQPVAPRGAAPRSQASAPNLANPASQAPAATANAAPPQSVLRVDWKAGKLSVDARAVSLVALLREIARQTGLKTEGLGQLRGEAFAQFAALGLSDALGRLLADADYALVQGIPGGGAASPPRLVVFSQRASVPAAPQSATVAAAEPVSPIERKWADIEKMAERGDEDGLLKALRDPDPSVQTSAYEALIAQNKDRAMEVLAADAKNGPANSRLQALELLDQSAPGDDPRAMAALRDALNDSDSSLSTYAVQALANRGGTEAMDDLRQALNNPDPSMRLMVLESVAQSEAGIPLLQQALSDTDDSVRGAAEALLRQAEARSNPPAKP